ncbi:MAG: hypothetical protein Ct9H300mP28_21930 [Pseudomonadota bacterium]|nr:MAG: hypothetical protein Ct9H300mP28_21930 [Pseudomonadota bacterium]
MTRPWAPFRKAYQLEKGKNRREKFGTPSSASGKGFVPDWRYDLHHARTQDWDNYHQAIEAYKTAIRITKDAQKLLK